MKSLTCPNCKYHFQCCRFKAGSGFAFVGIRDAKRIRAKIGKDFSYFLDYSPLSKKVVAGLKHGDPALEGALRYSQLDKRNRILRLKTKKNGDCIFLDGAGNCSIYGIRPNICRMFPFWAMRLISGRIKVIEHAPDTACIKPVLKGRDDVSSVLSAKEISDIKKVFRDIENEDKFYKRNIAAFAAESRFLKNSTRSLK